VLRVERGYALEKAGYALLQGNRLPPEAMGVSGHAPSTPRLPTLEAGVLLSVLLLIEYHLAPLIPTGTPDLRRDRQTLAVRGETPDPPTFSRNIFQ
jgi:hypothetical protein